MFSMSEWRPPRRLSAEELHERLFVMDTHADTPTASLMTPGWDFCARHTWNGDGSQCALPRLQDGGVDAMVFAIYVMQAARTPEGYAAVHQRAMDVIERTRAVLQQQPEAYGLALTAEDSAH